MTFIRSKKIRVFFGITLVRTRYITFKPGKL